MEMALLALAKNGLPFWLKPIYNSFLFPPAKAGGYSIIELKLEAIQ